MDNKFITSSHQFETVGGPIRNIVRKLNTIPFVATYDRSAVGYNSEPIKVNDEFQFDGYVTLVVCPELEHVQSLLHLLDKDVSEHEHSRVYATDLTYDPYGLIERPASKIDSTQPLATTYDGYEVFGLLYGHDFRHLQDTSSDKMYLTPEVTVETSSLMIEIGNRWNQLETILSAYCSYYDSTEMDYDKREFYPFE